MAATADREKALATALQQIEKQHGKGSIMRLGEQETVKIAAIPTGSVALDVALGVANGMPQRTRNLVDCRAHVVTQPFAEAGQVGVVENESSIVLDHAEAFAGSVEVGVNDSQRGRGLLG